MALGLILLSNRCRQAGMIGRMLTIAPYDVRKVGITARQRPCLQDILWPFFVPSTSMAGQVVTPDEKILILLSLCDHWTWSRPKDRIREFRQINCDRKRPVAIVKLWYTDRYTRFAYGSGLRDIQKYRRVLKAFHSLGVPLPDFGYEDLNAIPVR